MKLRCEWEKEQFSRFRRPVITLMPGEKREVIA